MTSKRPPSLSALASAAAEAFFLVHPPLPSWTSWLRVRPPSSSPSSTPSPVRHSFSGGGSLLPCPSSPSFVDFVASCETSALPSRLRPYVSTPNMRYYSILFDIIRYCAVLFDILRRNSPRVRTSATALFAFIRGRYSSAFCLLPSAFSLQPSAFCLLPSACCLLPAAFSLQPSAFCLVPSAFCLLPSDTPALN
jgi:hypothetical protein